MFLNYWRNNLKSQERLQLISEVSFVFERAEDFLMSTGGIFMAFLILLRSFNLNIMQNKLNLPFNAIRKI